MTPIRVYFFLFLPPSWNTEKVIGWLVEEVPIKIVQLYICNAASEIDWAVAQIMIMVFPF